MDKPSRWLIWAHELERGGASLDTLTGYSKDFKLLFGEPVLHEFPKRARYPLVASSDLSGPRKPRKNYDPVMTDSLHNIDSNLVLSERVVDVLRARGSAGVELIPVPVIGLDKKRRPERYFIVNPVGLVDAIDPKKTRASWSKDKSSILGITRLVLDKKKLPEDRALIRLARRNSLILVRRELAEAVLALAPTGVRFEEIADHSTL